MASQLLQAEMQKVLLKWHEEYKELCTNPEPDPIKAACDWHMEGPLIKEAAETVIQRLEEGLAERVSIAVAEAEEEWRSKINQNK